MKPIEFYFEIFPFLASCLLGINVSLGADEIVLPSGEGEKKTIIEGAKEGQAGTRVSDLTAGLRLLLWTNKAEYRVGEPIHVDFRVYNTGRRPVNVYAEFDREGWLVFLEMRKKDGNQEPVYQSTPAQVATRRPRDSLYMALPPGGTVGRFYTLLGTPGKPFPAGEYEIQAGYTNTYETCLASLYFHDEDIRALGRRAYVRLWTGQLVSAPVPIRVKGKMPKGTEKGEKEEKGERGLFRKR